MEWNFLAAQHGKGVCDGLGATIKQFVWKRVKSDRTEVMNASQFVLASEGSNICVTEIPEKFIVNTMKSLKLENLISSAENIPNIMNSHCIFLQDEKIVANPTSFSKPKA